MLSALRRETVKFRRGFVECWTRSSGKFKTTSVLFALYLFLIVATEIVWRVFSGHRTPNNAGVVLLLNSMQLANFIGKKRRWF